MCFLSFTWAEDGADGLTGLTWTPRRICRRQRGHATLKFILSISS